MCGIAGIYNFQKEEKAEENMIKKMCSHVTRY
jgi:asparagine synthetase B (glutamine-hydrolysing)